MNLYYYSNAKKILYLYDTCNFAKKLNINKHFLCAAHVTISYQFGSFEMK